MDRQDSTVDPEVLLSLAAALLETTPPTVQSKLEEFMVAVELVEMMETRKLEQGQPES